MQLKRLGLVFAVASMLGVSAQTASSEQLTVATFVPPQHHTNTVMFKWFGDELEKRSGGTLTMQLFPAGQLGAGPVQQYKRAVEEVADITFGVSAYTPALFPRTMLAIPPGKAENSADATRPILAVFDEYLADEYSDEESLSTMRETTGKRYDLIEVTGEERARMDATVAEGMTSIFADYAARGIDNAEEIYNAINK